MLRKNSTDKALHIVFPMVNLVWLNTRDGNLDTVEELLLIAFCLLLRHLSIYSFCNNAVNPYSSNVPVCLLNNAHYY